jgi:predicted transposase YbfD/YdcC
MWKQGDFMEDDPYAMTADERAALDEFNARRRAYSRAYRAANLERIKAKQKAKRSENKEKLDAYHREWQAKNRGSINARSRTREATKLRATPAWADKKAIKEHYEHAAFLTRVLGAPYHVDHIVPLKSKIVCGLHWEGNMEVIEGAENIRKQNRWWPDMP